MHKILIVEDEQIERESMTQMISNLSPDILVEEASNGEIGLELYHDFKPDIIIADINMPKIGGLDMLEIIRKEDASVICFIITSYDYFQYAQRAIKLGVEDFILKPSDDRVIQNMVLKALQDLKLQHNTHSQVSTLVTRMNSMNDILNNEAFYALLINNDPNALQHSLGRAHIYAQSGLTIVHTHDNPSFIIQELEDLGFNCVSGNLSNTNLVFVLTNYQLNEDDITRIQNNFPLEISEGQLSIGSIKHELFKLKDSYHDLLQSIDEGKPQKVDKSILKESMYQKFIKVWGLKFSNQSQVRTDMIGEFSAELMVFQEDYRNEILNTTIIEIQSLINTQFSTNLELELVDCHNTVKLNYDIVSKHMNTQLTTLNRFILKQRNDQLSPLLKRALLNIETNYYKPINLRDVSKDLGISPNYLSKVFTNELNKNFTEVLNDFRIKEAKIMILDHLSIKEIALSIGYASQSYFTKVFRNAVGMSPSDYRNLANPNTIIDIDHKHSE